MLWCKYFAIALSMMSASNLYMNLNCCMFLGSTWVLIISQCLYHQNVCNLKRVEYYIIMLVMEEETSSFINYA